MIAGQQLADTHSAIALSTTHGARVVQLHCTADRAHAVFMSKVFVPK